MKQFILSLIALLCLIQFASAQTVDSIKVEQAGDFIKIRYKILNSIPGQMYRIKVLCSINGGLNSEIRSVSGDVGDNVVGGKSEYWVIWDVLKDVEEVKSVEFVVRAELMTQYNTNVPANTNVNLTGWDKKRFHIALVYEYPGPKLGARIGYMGMVGVTAKYAFGKTVMDADNTELYNFLKSNGLDENLHLDDDAEAHMYSLAGTVRIANVNKFQSHLMLGIAFSEFRFIEQNNSMPTTTFNMTTHKMFGPEVGLFLDISRFTITATFSNFNPKDHEESQTEKCWSNRSFFDMCLGVRF